MTPLRIILVTLGVLGLIALVAFLSGIGLYNGMVTMRQRVDASWAQVQNVYQRRADLVPNLVSTVSGAANFEKSTLIAVTDARASVGRVSLPQGAAPTDPAQLAAFDKAQGQLGAALSRLLVVSENYPQLRATEGFRDLQVQLEGTENRISVERERFNQAVLDYNVAIQSFPGVFFARALGFHERPYFQAAPDAEKAPQVKFDFGGTPAPAH